MRILKKSFNKPLTEIKPEDLVYIFGYRDIPEYLLSEFSIWKNKLELQPDNIFDILDMFVWEQKTANWGAIYPSEQDIAIDELSPFNCRLFNEIILSAPKEELIAPGYPVFKDLINYMWPELLSFPINPEPKFTVERIKEKVKIFIPDSVYEKLKSIKKRRTMQA